MEYSFNTALAKKYNSVDIAVFIKHFDFWLTKNKANNRNQHNGKYWTYNSFEAFQIIFDWLSVGQIRRILNKMIDLKIIETGNYNKSAYNRTKWYTFTNAFVENNKSILRFHQINSLKLTNEFDENDNSYNDTDILPYKNTNNNTNNKKFIKPTIEEIKAYCKERNNNIDAETFFHHYETNGWVQGKNKPIKNWKSAVITWEKNNKQNNNYSKDKIDEYVPPLAPLV